MKSTDADFSKLKTKMQCAKITAVSCLASGKTEGCLTGSKKLVSRVSGRI